MITMYTGSYDDVIADIVKAVTKHENHTKQISI